MQRTPVQSTNLVSVGYDAETQVLEIEFGEGAVYRYKNVPAEKHRELMRAQSKGGYFLRNIQRQYQWEKID